MSFFDTDRQRFIKVLNSYGQFNLSILMRIVDTIFHFVA